MLMNCELLSLPLLFILQARDHDAGAGDDPHGQIAEYYHNTTLMASVYCNELSNPGSEAWNFDDGSGGCIGLKVKRERPISLNFEEDGLDLCLLTQSVSWSRDDCIYRLYVLRSVHTVFSDQELAK